MLGFGGCPVGAAGVVLVLEEASLRKRLDVGARVERCQEVMETRSGR